MRPFEQAWNLLKGMNPLDDPRIQAHRHIPSTLRIAEGEGEHGAAYGSSGAARGKYDRDTVYEQQATRLARPPPRDHSMGHLAGGVSNRPPTDLTHKRRFEQVGSLPTVFQQVGEDTIDNSPPPEDRIE